VFSKNGGSLGETGSVAWMFDRKGVISLPSEGKKEDDVMEVVLDSGADDFSVEEDFFEVQTSIESFEPVRKTLSEKSFKIDNASLQWIAKNNIEVKGEDAEKVMKLIESLEDIDDVQNVYSNADIVE
jgi:transcriptional/translational regulatory protein YebC/TACO1